MAKSIYTTLDSLETTTSVPGFGTEIAHTIPRELVPTAEEFENDEKLLEWAEETGNLHACLQKGVQKFLIEIRATFKNCKKEDTWSVSYGQANVDAMEWSVTNRPNAGGGKVIAKAKLEAGIAMARAMASAGLDDSMILASLVPVYGEDVAKIILEAIQEAATA